MYSKMLGGEAEKPEITVVSDAVEGLLREFASF